MLDHLAHLQYFAGIGDALSTDLADAQEPIDAAKIDKAPKCACCDDALPDLGRLLFVPQLLARLLVFLFKKKRGGLPPGPLFLVHVGDDAHQFLVDVLLEVLDA